MSVINKCQNLTIEAYKSGFSLVGERLTLFKKAKPGLGPINKIFRSEKSPERQKILKPPFLSERSEQLFS
jgi:hypothetical protein